MSLHLPREFFSRLTAPGLLVCLVLFAPACGPAGSAPVLQAVADQVTAVNQELVVDLSAKDADGNEVLYSFEASVADIHSRAVIRRLPNGGGQFRWTPQARDVGEWFFDFTASDGSNSDTVTVRIEVRSAIGGNSSPRFVRPQGSGTILDLSVSSCIELSVEIADPDSTQVTIAQGPPVLEGAELDIQSGKTAIWSWCPSPSQVAADDRYNLLLTADDGDNPQRLLPYLLVLRSPLKPSCPGNPPVILHTPADVNSLLAISIDAEISDDIGLKQEPLLYYSESLPSAPPDLSSMTQATMVQGSGAHWMASIPNPVAGKGQGESATLYYVIVADDDDDVQGSCDHLTREPETGTFEILVTNPGGNGGAGLCESCTDDVQCGGAGDLCVAVGSGATQVCLSACGASCATNFVCSAQELESVNGTLAPQCVPVSQSCSDPSGTACVDDAMENNDSRQQAQNSIPLAADTTHALVSCPANSGVGDDEDWYRIVLPEEGSLDLDLAFGGTISDLDLALYSESGGIVATSSGFGSTEQLRLCLQAGTYFARVYAFGAAQNPYTLHYTSVPQACAASTCVADDLEEDDSALLATVVDLTQGVYERTGRTLCSADDDWYRVALVNSELLAVDLTFAQASGGDLDIHIFDANSVDLTPCSPASILTCSADLGQSGSANESTIFSAPASGCAPCTFYVVVKGFDGDENDYAIRIEGAN